MAIIEGGLEIQFPHMVKVKQNLTSCKLPAVADVLRKQLSETQIRRRIQPGMSVAVGVGSRGITDLLTLVKQQWKNKGIAYCRRGQSRPTLRGSDRF